MPRTFLDVLQKSTESAPPTSGTSTPQTPAPAKKEASKTESAPAAKPAPTPAPNRVPSQAYLPRQGGDDHFYLKLFVFFSFSIVTGLFGYALGKKQGFTMGVEHGVQKKSRHEIGKLPVKKSAFPRRVVASPRAPIKRDPVTPPALPTKPKTMTPTQKVAISPPDLRKYTLQIQDFGRKRNTEASELITKLKSQGFDVFQKNGVVYVGRFKSYKSSEARKTKRAIQNLRWKKRNFRDCFFTNLSK